jgi:cytochrome b561
MAAATPQSPGDRYTRTAIHLHWIIAGLILCGFVLGWVMTSLAISPLRLRMVNWHKWVGISVLLLVALRTLWRLTHTPPVFRPMPRWQRWLANGVHGALYALLFALPVSGWFYSNAAGYPVVYLGLVRLPNIVSKDKLLSQNLHHLHHLLGLLLLTAVGLHVMAVIKHHFLDRDGTFSRMLFTNSSDNTLHGKP